MGLSDFLYPREIYCISCGAITEKGSRYGICTECMKKIHFRTDTVCGAAVCMDYGILERDLILRFKYGGEAYLGKHLCNLLYDRLVSDGDVDFDCIVPVPAYRKKLRERGYNQCSILAAGLSELLKVPSVPLLAKTKHKTSMNKLDTAGRAANVKGSFKPVEGAEEYVRGKKVLLVDDVLTSGATVEECFSVLQRAGAAKLSAVVLAGNGK